jgi:transposase
METVFYVGMDVHKESIQLAVLKNGQGRSELEQRLPYDFSKVRKFFGPLTRAGTVFAAYEAGSMGFDLARVLSDMTIQCVVAAPGRIARAPADRVKTDRRDALMIAQLLRNSQLEAVHVPTRDDEAVRDYLRARADLKLDYTRTKQRLSKFFLRHGHIYPGSPWTKRHMEWMRSIQFNPPMLADTFEGYLGTLLTQKEQLKAMDAQIELLATGPRYAAAVARLRCLKGIDYLTALSLVCEVGDFRRFERAEQFMGFLGLVPGERSSGPRRRQGGITKAGNVHLRKLLVEASWHYRYHAAASERLIERRNGQKPEVIAYAERARERLQKKFARLVHRKAKKSQVAVTAVARELSGFVWGLMAGKIA